MSKPRVGQEDHLYYQCDIAEHSKPHIVTDAFFKLKQKVEDRFVIWFPMLVAFLVLGFFLNWLDIIFAEFDKLFDTFVPHLQVFCFPHSLGYKLHGYPCLWLEIGIHCAVH